MATKVVVRGNLDQALRKFKAKVNKDGIPQESKKRESYIKPGVRRRTAKQEGIKNEKKRNKASNKDKDKD